MNPRNLPLFRTTHPRSPFVLDKVARIADSGSLLQITSVCHLHMRFNVHPMSILHESRNALIVLAQPAPATLTQHYDHLQPAQQW